MVVACREGTGIASRNDIARLTGKNDLRNASDAGGDNGQFVGHGLQYDISAASAETDERRKTSAAS